MDLLLIDPDPFSLKAYQNVFELWGFRVTPCSSGSDLKDILGHSTFDAVVTELDLPGTERGQLIPLLRKQLPTKPLIVLTENVSVQSAIQAIRNGADDYLLKPLNPERLRTLVQQYVSRKSREGSAKISAEMEDLSSLLYHSIHRAIHHLHEKEDYIRFLELLHRVSFEQISDAVLVLDPTGQLLLMNEHMRELLGIELTDETDFNLLGHFPELKESFLAEVQKMKTPESTRLRKTVFQRPRDGARFELEGQVTSVQMPSRHRRLMAVIVVINRIQPVDLAEEA